MKTINFRNVLIVLAAVALLGFGVNAFAGWGMGYPGPGPGWHHRGWGAGDYPDNRWNMSEDDYKKMDAERQSFFKDTEPLRQKIYEKELALRSELAKETPDAKRAGDLQKELSDLTSQLDQKQLDHMINMKKIVPYAGRGYGYGMGGGPMGFNGGPMGYRGGPMGFNGGPMGYRGGPMGFNGGPMGYGGGRGSCWR